MDLTDLMRDDTQQTLTLTVMEGPPQVKTRQDVSNMSLDEFAMLTAVGSQNLGLSTELFNLVLISLMYRASPMVASNSC